MDNERLNKEKKPCCSVIITALNEEENIIQTMDTIRTALGHFNVEGELIVVDDGSTDRTGELVKAEIVRDQDIRLIRHDRPRGVGASFWDGVDMAQKDVVVWFPGDNENDPYEIFRYYELLQHVDIVIPFTFNKEVRPLFRNALSFIYRYIINTTFLVNFNYTNGTNLYRKSMLKELSHRSNAFFFQTDILIRAVKKGYLFAEVPYKLSTRVNGVSKAVKFPSLLQVIKGYLKLTRDYYFMANKGWRGNYTSDSRTVIRRQK